MERRENKKETKTSHLTGQNMTRVLINGFLKRQILMCLKIVLIFVLFPEMVAWKTTGDGHKRNASFWSDSGGCWQVFQLSFWTDTKERVIKAKTIQLQRLISV